MKPVPPVSAGDEANEDQQLPPSIPIPKPVEVPHALVNPKEKSAWHVQRPIVECWQNKRIENAEHPRKEFAEAKAPDQDEEHRNDEAYDAGEQRRSGGPVEIYPVSKSPNREKD